MSRVNGELLPRLKPSDRKRQSLYVATPSRTSLGALRSIRDDAVQRRRVHKNMQQMIKNFLHIPDNEADAPLLLPGENTLFDFKNCVSLLKVIVFK